MKNNFPEVSLADISRNLFRKNIFFAALSGILLFLSFPKYGSGVLAWVALVPLFYALKNAATIVMDFLV
jgi:apolipoprotein N-acyltransferase